MAEKDHDLLSGSAPARRMYTLTGLPSGSDGDQRVAQKTYIGPEHAYVLQVYSNATYGELSKADINGSTLDFSQYEPMRLNGFGHGQTLEYFSHNNTDYFWIGTKGVATRTDYNDNDLWATQLGRLPYQEGATVEYDAIDRLTYLTRLTGSTEGAIERVEAALSTDRNYMLIMTVNQDHSKARFTIYDHNAIQTKMDGNSALSMADLTGDIIDTWSISGSIYSKIKNGSIQGIDLANKNNNGGFSVYISSGNTGEQPCVTKVTFGSTSGLSEGKYIDNIYWPISQVETEGVQIFDATNLYVGIAYHSSDLKTTQDNYLYYAAKSDFTAH